MRRNLLQVSLILLVTLFPSQTGYPTGTVAVNEENIVNIIWLGHAATEIATTDYKKIVYVDPWITNPAWEAFNLTAPYQYANVANLVTYIEAKDPDIVVILLTSDHGDHIGDLFELVEGLIGAEVEVKIVAIYELAFAYIAPKIGELGEEIVVNLGSGMNLGGTMPIDGVQITMTEARHSSSENLIGAPAVGYIITINQIRIYHSGATALFSDMKLIRELYKPHVALLPVGDLITMNPWDAAIAVKYVHPDVAIPIHYATSSVLRGVEAASEFETTVNSEAPDVKVEILKPGDLFVYREPVSKAEGLGWAMYVSIGVAVVAIIGMVVWRLRIRKRTRIQSPSSTLSESFSKLI